MERQLLNSPIADLTHEQLIFTAAANGIHGAEFLRQLSSLAKFADRFSVQLQFIDLAIRVDILWRIRIGTVQILARSWRDTNRRRASDAHDLGLECSLAIEHLNSFIAAVCDVYVTLSIGCNPVDRVELPVFRSARSPRLDEFAVLVELRHAGVTVTVGYVDVAGRVPRNIRRSLKEVALLAGAGKSSAAAASRCRRVLRSRSGRRHRTSSRSRGRRGQAFRFGLPAEQ